MRPDTRLITASDAARLIGVPIRTAIGWTAALVRAGMIAPAGMRRAELGRHGPAPLYRAGELLPLLRSRAARRRARSQTLSGPATPESLARLDLVLLEICEGAPLPSASRASAPRSPCGERRPEEAA
jgi:hypothetical protein